MTAYRPPYISFYAFTWDRPDNELRPVWLRLDCWTETWNYCTGLISYRSHVNDNKSQAGSRNFKPVRFLPGSAIYLFDKTCHFVLKPGTKHFVPVSCKRLQKFHTDKSSYQSEFVQVSCADQLETSASPPRANLGCLPTFDLVWVCVWGGENWAGSVRFQTILFSAPKSLTAIKHVFGRDGRV